MKINIKEHLFKIEVDKVEPLKNDNLDISFMFKKSRIHIKISKLEYDNQKIIYVLTEPTFYKKKPKNFVWSFDEIKIRQIYLNLILDKIKEKENTIFKRKKII